MHLTVTTYKELEKWCNAYANGAFGLFFLIGHQGQAKSTFIRKLMEAKAKAKPKPKPKRKGNPPTIKFTGLQNPDAIKEPLWVEGGAVSAFKMFQELWFHQHQPVVMDDVDSVYSDRNLIRLLKALCQTEDEKSIGWHTDSRQLEALEIPTKFKTRSHVCIIANRWKTLSEHVGSLVDRGMMINFHPTPIEVYNYAKREKVVTDKDIMKFVHDHLWMLDELSLRTFVVAQQSKKAKLNWKNAVLESLGIRDAVLVEQLEKKKFPTTEARVSEFMRLTLQSRPMYFKAASQLAELRARKNRKGPKTKTFVA